MKKAPALQTVTIAVLIALASLGAPAFAARTLQELATTPVSSTAKPAALTFATAGPNTRPGVEILGNSTASPVTDTPVSSTQKPAALTFETASPTARPGVEILGGTAGQVPTLHTCPTETGFLPLTTKTEAGATQCAKTYPRAEMWGAVLIPGYNTDETQTEVFALEMEPNHQLNGAILSGCYQRMKEFLAAIAAGDTDSATSYLQPSAHLTDKFNQPGINGAQEIAEWFASYFGNRPSPTVKVFDVSWALPEPEADYKYSWTLEMIVRAETDTQVIKFDTRWSLQQEPYLLYYVEDVGIADKD